MAQVLLKKPRGRFVGFAPVAPQQKFVDFVWKNQVFHGDFALAESVGQNHRLVELDIAVIVAMNQKNRRAPVGDKGDGGGIKRGFRERIAWRQVIFHSPIVNAVQVNSRLPLRNSR